jgi:MscS family membrane protein
MVNLIRLCPLLRHAIAAAAAFLLLSLAPAAPGAEGLAEGAPAAASAEAGATNSVVEPSKPAVAPYDPARAEQLSFGLSGVKSLQQTALGVPLWQYAASLAYIFLAFFISKVVDFVISGWLRKAAAKKEGGDKSGAAPKFTEMLIQLTQSPIRVISFMVFLQIGLDVLKWPEWLQVWISRGLYLIMAVSITWLLLRLTEVFIGQWKAKAAADSGTSLNEQLFPVLRRSVQFFIIVVSVLVTADNIGLNVTSLIASLSIGGLALGLAAQDTVANLFGAVMVFLDKPFKVGDRIQLDAIDGTVETIGLRSTRVRNLDGFLVTIPNKTMGNATITNVDRRPSIKTVMNIGLTYDTPVERVKVAIAIITQVYKDHPKTKDLIVSFNSFAASSLNILVIHWWDGTSPRDLLAALELMNLELKRRFDGEQLSFAFPTQTLHLKQDSDWKILSQGGPHTAG